MVLESLVLIALAALGSGGREEEKTIAEAEPLDITCACTRPSAESALWAWCFFLEWQ